MKPSTIASVIASALSTELAAQSTDPKGSIRGDDASYPSQLTIRLRVPAVMKYHTHPGSNLRTQSFEEGSGDTTHVGIGQTRPIEMRTISLPLFGGDKWSLILSQPEAITYTDGETHKIIRVSLHSFDYCRDVSRALIGSAQPARRCLVQPVKVVDHPERVFPAGSPLPLLLLALWSPKVSPEQKRQAKRRRWSSMSCHLCQQ